MKYIDKDLFYKNSIVCGSLWSEGSKATEQRMITQGFDNITTGSVFMDLRDRVVMVPEIDVFHFLTKSSRFQNLYNKLNEKD